MIISKSERQNYELAKDKIIYTLPLDSYYSGAIQPRSTKHYNNIHEECLNCMERLGILF